MLHCGDLLGVLPTLPADSFHAVVTDPPYGLGFMGKGWDHAVPGVPYWEAALRVARSGAHLLAFGGTRTWYRLACAIEDAGWVIRDTIMWVYGSGFPKALDVSKAIDKEAGAERERLQPGNAPAYQRSIGNTRPWMDNPNHTIAGPIPATDAAREWFGWGTALKPAWEPIVMAMKPTDGTFAHNAVTHGVAGLNVDACRIATAEAIQASAGAPGLGGHSWGEEYAKGTGRTYRDYNHHRESNTVQGYDGLAGGASFQRTGPFSVTPPHEGGRFPANLIHDGSDEVLAGFPSETGKSNGTQRTTSKSWLGTRTKDCDVPIGFGDSGSAARFFYCAKATRRERERGLRGHVACTNCKGLDSETHVNERGQTVRCLRNDHPTVKPLELMRYLCRLVCPPGGTVLDPFMGSGSTGVAAVAEGFGFVGIDTDARAVEIARRRIGATERRLVAAGTA